ncbi:MAG: adenylate/guanylate cyclase domain-containing protein, partial [Bradyrhizobiaceae bacterium]|nr:adenylate/guanylate cyclase domain-containing protein [Bradyrhizobiaceae bacterium]
EREEREREKALLYGALPKHIADRMLRGEDVSGDEHPSVSVLFMDIAGFTSHSQTLHPREVTELLDRLFESIDKACTEYHVVKIKTIGDAYLAVAFPLSDDHDAMQGASTAHELRITQVATQVMQHGLSWPDGSPVQVRIGLHTGAVVAGVIGTQRLQYDVWGDTVNTASRMESTSEPGRIHASDVFAQALAQHDSPYVCTPRGTIEVKGRGSMQTYWVEA